METVVLQGVEYAIWRHTEVAHTMFAGTRHAKRTIDAEEWVELLGAAVAHPNLIVEVRLNNGGHFVLHKHFLFVENGEQKFLVSYNMNLSISFDYDMDDTLARLRKLHLLTDPA